MTPEALAAAAERLAEFDPAVAFALELKRLQAGQAEAPSALEDGIGTQLDRIKRALLAGPMLTTEIAAATGLSTSLVASTISNATRLIEHDRRASGRAWYWRLTEAGKASCAVLGNPRRGRGQS